MRRAAARCMSVRSATSLSVMARLGAGEGADHFQATRQCTDIVVAVLLLVGLLLLERCVGHVSIHAHLFADFNCLVSEYPGLWNRSGPLAKRPTFG